MKGKYKYLLRMQLYDLFGINRLIHSRDKQEKQRSAIVGALGLTAIAILVVYTTKFSNSMALAGLSEALPTLMVVVCSLATLTLTFVKSTGVLIGLKDYDMVMSMPVSTISIVTSRITMLYLINLIIGFIAMLPSSIIYVVYEHPPVFSGCVIFDTDYSHDYFTIIRCSNCCRFITFKTQKCFFIGFEYGCHTDDCIGFRKNTINGCNADN